MSDESADEVARKRQQARERQRRHRARKRAESATQPPEDGDGAEGSTVDAVRDELDEIPAADRQPGAAAALLRLAAVLDDPTATPQAPSAARALLEGLERLRGGDEEQSGRLAELRSLHGGNRGA